jgi:putative ABC transport system ATP-binding protein
MVCGQDVARGSHAARAQMRLTTLGYVFQDYNLVSALTVGENVAMPLELAGMRASEARAHTARALESVGLAGMSDRYPDDLSGGERQRVAIARATVGEPRIVLADEPTGALDSANANSVMALLREVVVAGLVVTHNPSVAERADRILHLRDGCLSQEPNPRRLAASRR